VVSVDNEKGNGDVVIRRLEVEAAAVQEGRCVLGSSEGRNAITAKVALEELGDASKGAHRWCFGVKEVAGMKNGVDTVPDSQLELLLKDTEGVVVADRARRALVFVEAEMAVGHQEDPQHGPLRRWHGSNEEIGSRTRGSA
jgi:hypothetical protein